MTFVLRQVYKMKWGVYPANLQYISDLAETQVHTEGHWNKQ